MQKQRPLFTTLLLGVGCLCLALTAALSAAAEPSAAVPPASQAGGAQRPGGGWLKTPTVSVMTGFIYEPLKPYTIQHWMENLGHQFDADQWVQGFQEAGATHLVFYDKWIDGLVFHDTKTTNFKTKRDFVRELAAACQRRGLPLVFYFNAVSDGNPEFDEWATLDRQGKPIVFGEQWPTRYQTLHSPFRQKAVEQVRELLSNYGPIHGLWHDIFAERLNTSSPWVARGYQDMFGEPFDKASGAKFGEFNARTLASYLDQADAIRREQRQTACLFTSNGSGTDFLSSGIWTDWVGSRLQYFFNEGHSFASNEALARMAWVLPRPLDINLLLNKTWFTPLEDEPPASHLTEKQAIAGTAIAICQGAGVNFALTPGHSGRFGQDLQRAKAAGNWFRGVKSCVQQAQPYADVAIVLGTPAAGGPGLPGGSPFWKRRMNPSSGAWYDAVAISDALTQCGIFSRILYQSAQGGNWPPSLKSYRAVIVPELAVLDEAHLANLRQYVQDGGCLLAFGHATLLDERSQRRQAAPLGDVFGVSLEDGEVAFPAAKQQATYEVDSEYNADYGAHVLLDGRGEAWASNGAPMPHWIQVNLPQPVEVARVVVVNRAGPYQITDVELESGDGQAWKSLQAVHGATTREITLTLAPARSLERLRVKILRELYQGQDRPYADVQAVQVWDAQGKNWGGRAARVPLALAERDLTRMFGDPPAEWVAQAVRAKPTTATVAAQFQTPELAPALLRNRFGAGTAWLVTASDGSFDKSHSFWTGLMRLIVAEPTLRVQPEDAQRYRFILTRIATGHVLHVIDSQADASGAPPRAVAVSLIVSRLGNARRTTLIGRDEPLPSSLEGERISFTVQPDPVASVLLQ